MDSLGTQLGFTRSREGLNYLTVKEVSMEVRFNVKLIRRVVHSLIKGGQLARGEVLASPPSAGGRRHLRIHREAVVKIKDFLTPRK